MPIRFDEIGLRLRAYRLGKNFTADDVARILGISRAAVYRLEKGELVKIQTLEALSELLEVSLSSLLGAEVEYYDSPLAYFERVRQLEETSTLMLGNFAPISMLLLSDEYMGHLRVMLIESVQQADETCDAGAIVDRIFPTLMERRAASRHHRCPTVNIVGTQDIMHLLHFGLVGRYDLPAAVVAERRLAARREIEHLADIMEREPIGVQIGIVAGLTTAQAFRIFERSAGPSVTISPFRLGAHPNITSGTAMVTSAVEAVKLFKETITSQWERAYRGPAGAAILREMAKKTATAD